MGFGVVLVLILQLLVLASILFVSYSAFAGSTWTLRFGWHNGTNFVYTTNISYDGICGTNCKKYYSGDLNFCSAEGVYGQVRDTGYYYYNFYYSLNDGYSWNNNLDYEGISYASPYWYHRGWDTSHYTNWYGPGNCTKVSYMLLYYRYTDGGTLYSRIFQGPSCNCIE